MADVRTTCPYCGVGCGVIATPDGAGGAEIAGDPDHPANFGKLCSKGSALGETLALETRLLHPQMNGARISWDLALARVAQGLSETIARHGPDSVAFYLSGQLLSEDYYVANKLMKGFIGSGNVDTNSRLCMSSSVAGHKRAFGSDSVPGCYEDLDRGDLFVLVGSNAAWCHPILYRRIMAAKERGARLIVIDPRLSATAEDADLHLPIKPGTDTALFSGLLAHLAASDALATDYIAAHTQGIDAALAKAQALAGDIATTAALCDLAPENVAAFFAAFANTQRVVTIYSQGVNQSAQGTDKVNAIINCHLATGRIGAPGMGPFSFTGQPNAMGGREVGGMANQLAAHMDFTPDAIDRVGRFWNTANVARKTGLKAVDMFEAVADGRIRALWVMGTNPAVSLPRADFFRAAIKKLDLFIVSENVASNDTLRSGDDMKGDHIRLPAAAWAEKEGSVTNSERRISRQRAFLPLPGEARPDWLIICDVATRMGFGAAFAFQSPAAIFAEHASLSAFENDGARDFDLGGLADISATDYATLAPVQWPVDSQGAGKARLFADGRFFTPTQKARFIALDAPALADRPDAEYPLLLNTGRLRDQWHTMTRSGLSPRLGGHAEEPFVSVHPDDAARYRLVEGGFAEICSPYGEATLRVRIAGGQRAREIFAPIHWSDETASPARVSALVRGATDAFSGQPETKATPVRIAPVARASAGFILAREKLALPAGALWAWRAVEGGYAAHLATDDVAAVFAAIDSASPEAERLVFRDVAQGVERGAWLLNNRAQMIFFVGPSNAAPHWGLARSVWNADKIEGGRRRMALSGVQSTADADDSPLVCSCFGVSHAKIASEIAAGALTIAEIGARLKAGTNCGSCQPEIRGMINAQKTPSQLAAE